MSYGRPGAMLVFSPDNGRTWTDQTVVDTTPYSGYTDVVELSPGLLLVGFGTKDFLDPATGTAGRPVAIGPRSLPGVAVASCILPRTSGAAMRSNTDACSQAALPRRHMIDTSLSHASRLPPFWQR